ncbi:MAG: hypothetical protein ACYTCU_04770 [Planctomycetota bacterium]|jgi:hypothetical protein
MEARFARILVLTGTGLSIIFLPFALFAHNRLYSNDLGRAHQLERSLREDLAAPDGTAPETPPSGPAVGSLDPVDLALALQPAVIELDASPFFDDAEMLGFVAAKMRGDAPDSTEARTLMPPLAVRAAYTMGTVVVDWRASPVNKVLSSTLAAQQSDLRLAHRIYRGIDLAPPEHLQTVPFGTRSWPDRHLPLAASRLDYEVWTVLLRSGGGEDVLVGAERSEKVTVASPDHFRLELVGGSTSEAVFDVHVELPTAAGTVSASLRPGDELMVGRVPTGLILQSLTQSEEDVLTTQRRLVLTTDGSLVLDPNTNEPRTTQTQVLVPVTRITASLVRGDGEIETLEVDLP